MLLTTRASAVSVLFLALSSGCGGDDDAPGEAGGGVAASGGTGATGAAGSGGSGAGSGGGGVGGEGGGAPVGNPHPLYPPLSLDELPGDGGGESGPYEPPVLPSTSRIVIVTSSGATAGDDLEAACATPGTAVEVPSAAGAIGVVNLGGVDDCDVTLGPDVVIEFLVIGSLVGPQHAPSHRVRIRGGQIGSTNIIGGSTDIVLDGVVINNGAVPVGQRSGAAIYAPEGPTAGEVVDRLAVVSSFIRLVAVDAGGALDGCAFLGGSPRNVLFANNNVVTAGNRNSWGFRFSGGENILLVDNSVRVSFHKLVRLNDAPVDYVYIKGGTWMREATFTPGGDLLNDSFAQLSGSTTHDVFIHDPAVYLMPNTSASFGMAFDAVQAGRYWEARNVDWHVTSAAVMSDDRLGELEGHCASVGATCDYGIGTHSFTYGSAVAFPDDPWRDLPTFEDDDPDHLPVL